MAQRTNHPLKSLFLLAIVGALGWGAYHFVYKGGLLTHEPSQIDVKKTRERVRSLLLDAFADDLCIQSIDEVAYRANEGHFRIRVTLSHTCGDQARELCEEIVNAADDEVEETLGVFAYDQAGNLLGKYVQ